MALIPARTIRDHLRAMAEWSPARADSEARRFSNQQPVVNAYLLATVEGEGRDATGFALQLAHAIDGSYRHALDRTPRRISPSVMDRAAAESERGFEQLVGVEPELALRRMLFQRDMAEPELLAELLRLIFEESEADSAMEPAIGVLFLAIKAVALAYERANGLAEDSEHKGSLGGALESQLGHPLPRVGRNDPCPCGSGKKFKKCCGGRAEVLIADESPIEQLGDSPTEQRFLAYMDLVEQCMIFGDEFRRERDGRWLWQRSEDFERRFRPGEPGGAPDSLHVSYLLFDLVLPTVRKSVGQLFLERERDRLIDPEPTLLRHLCDSYVAFYELIERRPADGTKRLRELVAGTEWITGDVDDPTAESGEAGEVWCVRLVGPCHDAVTFSSPLVFQPEARDELEELVRGFIATDLAAGLPLAEALRMGMKRAVGDVAEFLVVSGEDPVDDEGDEDNEAQGEDEPQLVTGSLDAGRSADDLQLERTVEGFVAEHYRTWPDRPVPALSGKTPRAAVRTKAGRKQVQSLLDTFERLNATLPPHQPPIDVAWLRRELGLDR